MKKWFMAALALLAVAGCSTNPTDLKPVKDKYTFQALSISLSTTDSDPSASSFATTQAVSGFDSSGGSILPTSISQPPIQEDIEALLNNPNATIIEFPVVCAGVGETVTNAQTEVYVANVDAKIVDGEIVHEKESYDLGDSSTFTVLEILENGSISCAFKISHTKLVGTEAYKTDEGIEIETPYFEALSRGTHITLPPNTWFQMGGSIDEHYDGTNRTETHRSFYVRVLPPK
ncbi:MAG: hypothetical protein JXR23_07805 [Pontiellaceae bacterium]|nr:hypothetical protein [Pontiellaceae bacterium]